MKWYPRDSDAFIAGTVELTLEEIGAYTLILDALYSRNGNLPDDERFIAKLLRCDIRVWRRIRRVLISTGKIVEKGGQLTNCRATSELSRALHRMEVAVDMRAQQLKNQALKVSGHDRITTITKSFFLKGDRPGSELENIVKTKGWAK